MPTDGKFVEIVGNYNPTDLSQPLNIQKDRVEYWISKGAKPTNTVAKLLNKQGFSLPVEEYHKAPKKVAKPAETVATTPTAPATEKPIEEAPAPKAEEQPVPEVVVETTSEVEASTEEKYCFVDAPEDVQRELANLKQGNIFLEVCQEITSMTKLNHLVFFFLRSYLPKIQ